MKKKLTWVVVLIVIAAVVTFILFLGGEEPENKPMPTSKPTVTVAPTDPVPTNTPVPTLAPSAEPTEAVVPTETNTPVPTMAPQETLTPTPEPTAEPTPTELPHEHSWTKKAVFATCGAEGRSWEECACGAVQNEVITPKEEHKKCNYRVITEPTVTEEGTYETSCDECGTVVASGTIPKLTPTPVPTSTPTPKPTATPKPVCGHGSIETTLVKETDTELVYQDICELCGEVIATRNVAKATPTPKPTATPTPTIPLPTPTLVPELGDVVGTYEIPETEYESYEYTMYENMQVKQTFYKDSDTNVFDYTYYDKDGHILYNERLWKGEHFDGTFTVKYCLFEHIDLNGDNDYCRLVNSDGSMNKFSVHTFTGTRFWPTTLWGWAGEWPDMWENLLWIKFEGTKGSGQEVYITPDEFYSFEGKEGCLYEY